MNTVELLNTHFQNSTAELSRTLLQETNDPVFISDANGHFLEVNAPGCELLGYTPEELRQLSWSELLPTEIWGQIWLDGEDRIEGRIRHKGGDQLAVAIKLRRLPDGRRVAFVRDLGEPKPAQAAQPYKLLMEHSRDLILLVRYQDGRILEANAAAIKTYGYKREELLALSIQDLRAPHTRIQTTAQMSKANTQGILFETVHRRKDGSTFPVEVSSQGVELGGVTTLISVIRDITERQQIEEALYLTRFSVEHVADVINWVNETGRIVDVNETTCRMLGYSREEMLQRSVDDIDTAGSPESWQEAWQRLKQEQTYTTERMLRAKDGRIIPVEVVMNYIEFGRQALNCMFVRDISERKQAEAALQASEARLRRVSELVWDYAYGITVKPDGRYELDWITDAFTRITGYPVGPVVTGDNWIKMIHPEDVPLTYRLQQEIQAGRPAVAEYRIVTKEGQIRWLRDYSQPMLDKAGQVIHLDGAVQDITERKLAEEQLRASEERFRHVIASISDHIYVSEFLPDGQRHNRYLSPHLEVLTGYPHEKFEADWKYWSAQVIHPEDRAIAAAQAVQLAEGQNSEMEYRIIRADGRVIWVRDSARVERQGQTTLVYGLVTDITSRKQAEAAIRHLNEELEQHVADRTRELSALYEITAVASKVLKLETLLDETLKRVLATMTGSREAFIHLLDNTSQSLKLIVSVGASSEVVTRLAWLPMENSLAGWVLTQEEPLLISDMASDARSLGMPWMRAGDTYIGAPMRVGGHALGVLSIIGIGDQQFTMDDLALLASIADQVGVTVENARLRQQAEQTAVLQERERLARELHDSVTQSLYSLNLLASGGLKMVAAGELAAIQHNFSRIGETAQQALKEMRLLVHELRPLDLEREGLVGALHRRLNAVERRAQVTVRLVADDMPRLAIPLEIALYRVAQEALNNALKHAAATTITVSLYLNNEMVVLAIEDNGVGFDPDNADNSGGVGLASMYERVARFGGTLEFRSAPGAGTQVKARVRQMSPEQPLV